MENEFIIITMATVRKFISNKNASDLIALYIFYYKEARRQKTNQPRATISFVSRGLGWSDRRTRKIKKQLLEMGYVEEIIRKNKNTGSIIGWYIKVNYIWSKNKVNEIIKNYSHPITFPGGGEDQTREKVNTKSLSNNKDFNNTLNKKNKKEIICSLQDYKDLFFHKPLQVLDIAKRENWNCEKFINCMKISRSKTTQIIFAYFSLKELHPPNLCSLIEEYKLNIKHAEILKDYDFDFVIYTMNYVISDLYFLDNWSLKTVFKYINNESLKSYYASEFQE